MLLDNLKSNLADEDKAMNEKLALSAKAVPSEHVTLDPRLDLDGNFIDVAGDAEAAAAKKK